MKKLTTLITIFLGFAFAGALVATANTTPKTKESMIDVSGTWNLSVEFSGGGGGLGEAEVTGTIEGHDINFGFVMGG